MRYSEASLVGWMFPRSVDRHATEWERKRARSQLQAARPGSTMMMMKMMKMEMAFDFPNSSAGTVNVNEK